MSLLLASPAPSPATAPSVDLDTRWASYPYLAYEAAAARLTADQALAWLYAGLTDDPTDWQRRQRLSRSKAWNRAERVARKLRGFYSLRSEHSFHRVALLCFRNSTWYRDHGPQQGVHPWLDHGNTLVQEPGEPAQFREPRERGQQGPARRISLQAGDVQDVPFRGALVTADDLRKTPRAEEEPVVWTGKTGSGRVLRLSAPAHDPLTFLSQLARQIDPAFGSSYVSA